MGAAAFVVNKPGGGGVIGARAALKEAKPDGYTVLMDIVFAVKTDAPWTNFQELSDWVKANPDKLVWSSVGPSGPSRYTAFDWFSQIGVDPVKTRMVITDGAADSFAKLAGGHVLLSIHSVAEARAMAEGGRSSSLPSWPRNASATCPMSRRPRSKVS